MTKPSRSIDKNGFSNKFFEELDKEHDNSKTMAKRQKDLKDKHRKLQHDGQDYTVFSQEANKPF